MKNFYFIIILLCFALNTQAQTPGDSVKFAFLPAIGYTSDLGFMGGGLVSRYHYRENLKPFDNQQQFVVIGTTKGLFTLMYTIDKLGTFGTPWRSFSKVVASRVLNDTYYGIGNHTSFNKKQYTDGFYNYESYLFFLETIGRYPVWKNKKSGGQLDIILVVFSHYYDPVINNDNRFIALNSPATGAQGGLINAIGTGFMWDARDSETSTTRGTKAKLDIRYAPSFAGDFELIKISAEVAAYQPVSFLPNVVMAVKTGLFYSVGDVPYYMLPTIGGEYYLRGYNEQRFRGDGAMYYAAELRSWLLKFNTLNTRIGAQVFLDGGRVFENHNYRDYFKDHKHTVGAGIALSVFTPDFIVRADMGFSNEISRMYMGIGYTF